MVERVLFVHAHPDDESISTGGTIATLIDLGAHVTVVTCTRGERGEVVVDDLSHLEGDTRALAAERSNELSAAMRALGVTDHRFLGNADARWPGRAPRHYTDSGMTWTRSTTGESRAAPLEHVDAESLTAADQGEVAADIAAVISAVQPHVVVSYDADGGYGHPDHIRAHRASRIAADVLGVPFFAIVAPGGRGTSIMEVDVAPVFDKKRAALAAYRTQLHVEGDEWVSGETRGPIGAVEAFARLREHDDSFASNGALPVVVACVLAVIAGVVTGATLSVTFGETVDLAGLTVPWGFIVASFVTAALTFGLRLVFDTRVVAACAAIALVGVGAIFAVGPGGHDSGFTWIVPVALAGAALAWPQPWRAWRGNIGVSVSERS